LLPLQGRAIQADKFVEMGRGQWGRFMAAVGGRLFWFGLIRTPKTAASGLEKRRNILLLAFPSPPPSSVLHRAVNGWLAADGCWGGLHQ
jgi:hypothetical protein